MNILLTGGAGYLGSHTAIVLIEAGHHVVLLDNFSNADKEAVTRLESLAGQRLSLIETDVRDADVVHQALVDHNINAVIHFAGLKAVGESFAEPLAYYANNVGGTLSLLEAMAKARVKTLIFSSSATVYGIPQYLPIDEQHPLAPINPYGRTKAQIEQILEDTALADSSWRIANLRYFNPAGAHPSGLIGEDPHGKPNNLFPFVSRTASGEYPSVHIFGNDYPTADGTAIRDYIHVMDLADGHVAALDFLLRGEQGFNTFNLGTGCGYSVHEVIAAFEAAVGRPIPQQLAPRRAGDVSEYCADVSRARQVLGWQAKRSLKDMCETAWRFQNRLNRG